MNSDQFRRLVLLVSLAVAFVASVAYDTVLVQTNEWWQIPLVGLIAACFCAAFLTQVYPRDVVQPVLVAAWPLHIFTLGFFWMCFAIHRGAQLDQFVIYTLFSYATYVFVPLMFLLDRQKFVAFAKLVAAGSAVLAIPSLFGAIGWESLAGIPLRVKFSYAEFSGIIASGGVFEHPEGHAFQMAIGVLCSFYAWRTTDRAVYLPCLLLTLVGLIISQGRAVILGMALAVLLVFLPELFRRSRVVFLGTVFACLILPFFILPQLASLPGVAGYLRLERGMSGRGEAWRFARELVEKEPWRGYGFLASSRLTELERKALRQSGFSGAGTTFHNTFISRAVDLGIVVTGLYSLLYIVPLVRICRPTSFRPEQTFVRSMLLLTLTTSIFRDYNIGGVRSTAMIGAVFLGLACQWHLTRLWSDEPRTRLSESDLPRPADSQQHASSMS